MKKLDQACQPSQKVGATKTLSTNAPFQNKTISAKKGYKPRCSKLTKLLGFENDQSALKFYREQIWKIPTPNFDFSDTEEPEESGMEGLGRLFG